jgi:hypothetical protein
VALNAVSGASFAMTSLLLAPPLDEYSPQSPGAGCVADDGAWSPTSAKFSFGRHYLQVILAFHLAFRERAKHADYLREESENEEAEK